MRDSTTLAPWTEEETARQLVLNVKSLSRRPVGDKHFAVVFDSARELVLGVEAGIKDNRMAKRITKVAMTFEPEVQRDQNWWPSQDVWSLDLGSGDEIHGCDGVTPDLQYFTDNEGEPRAELAEVFEEVVRRAKGFHQTRLGFGLYPKKYPDHGDYNCEYCFTITKAKYVIRHRATRLSMSSGLTVLMSDPRAWMMSVGGADNACAGLERRGERETALVLREVLRGGIISQQVALNSKANVRTVRQSLARDAMVLVASLRETAKARGRVPTGVEKLRLAGEIGDLRELADDFFAMEVLLEDAVYWQAFEACKKPSVCKKSHKVPRHPFFPGVKRKPAGQFAVLRENEKMWRSEFLPFDIRSVDWTGLQDLVETPASQERVSRSPHTGQSGR